MHTRYISYRVCQYISYRTNQKRTDTICSMSQKDKIAERLRQARLQAGYAHASDFAKAFGYVESYYRHKENGLRKISVDEAKQFAAQLATKIGPHFTWSFLLGEGAASPQATMIGYIGAGEAIYPFDDEFAWEPVLAPPAMVNPLAAIVRGQSMVPVYRDGDILFFGNITEDYSALINQDCIVQIKDGPRQIKCLRNGKKPGFMRLYSYATATESDDVKIMWAAPVAWIKRNSK